MVSIGQVVGVEAPMILVNKRHCSHNTSFPPANKLAPHPQAHRSLSSATDFSSNSASFLGAVYEMEECKALAKVDEDVELSAASKEERRTIVFEDENGDEIPIELPDIQWLRTLYTEFDRVPRTVEPRSRPGSPHQMWQGYVTHIRQPGMLFAHYRTFCECRCSPYTGTCATTLTHQLEHLFYSSKHLDEDHSDKTTLQIFSAETSKAAETANELSETVFFHYDRLSRFVKRHEATMQKIWMRKSTKQRRALLYSAADIDTKGLWSSATLPANHRPECEATLNNCRLVPDNPMSHPAYAVPHINLEDLCDGETLLNFLRSRGRNLPGIFCHQDFNNCGIVTRQLHRKRAQQLGLVSSSRTDSCRNCPEPAFQEIPGVFMSFTGKSTAEEAAELLNWSQARKLDHFPIDEALMILSMQGFTYSFLDRVCMSLLQELDANILANPWSSTPAILDDALHCEQPDPGPASTPESASALPSIAKIIRNAVYQIPMRLDFTQLESLVTGRIAEAEEHLWSLRSDPGYFREVLQTESDNSPLLIQGPTQKVSPDVHDGKGSSFFWMSVIETMIRSSHIEVALYRMLHKRLDKVRKLIKTGEMGRPLFAALCELNGFVTIAADYASKELYLSSTACFRDSMRIHEHIGHCTHEPLDLLLQKPDSSLVYLFSRVGLEAPGHRHSADWVLSDFAQGIFDSKTIEAKSITSHLRSRFNDWALLQEITRQIRLFHPWAKLIQDKTIEFSDSLLEELALINEFNRCAFGAAQSVADANFLGQNRFKYPALNARSESTVAAMRTAEEELRLFWHRVDQYCEREFKPIDRMLELDFIHTIVPLKTEKWTEPLAASKELGLTDDAAENLRNLERLTQQTCLSSPSTNHRGSKPKTRPEPSSEEPNPIRDPVNRPAPIESASALRIRVGKKAYKTLTSLFFTPSEQSLRSKEIPWNDFLHAMVAAGFAVQKLWGSIWHFQPTDPSWGRSIQFHDPHPSMKLDLGLARRFGKRLNRAYGWEFETFVRKEAGDREA